ncbi:MAG: type II toxin-antitoxin system death-on-curing family toxin [bacterium]
MDDVVFLSLADAVEIHADQIERYGGEPGVRDIGLLDAALAMPHASFGGEFLHKDLFEMAAAYAFHICQNHAFVDCNKRTALACALVFLEFNGVELRDPKGKLYEVMMSVASSNMDKTALAIIFRKLAKG